jgi:hypothetical protein
MPYIADYLWQDVLAAAKSAKLCMHCATHYIDDSYHSVRRDLDDQADKLEAALVAAEGGSSDT